MAQADSQSRLRDRFAVLLGPVAWLLLVALAAGTWTWAGRFLRTAEDGGLAQRTQVAAAFTRSYLTGLATRQRQDAARALADRTVSQERLEVFGAGLGYTSMILLDDRGRVMLTWPSQPALIGRDLADELEHVRLALQRDRITVSDVYASVVVPGRSLTAIAVPFPTPYGRRVFSGGLVAADSPLGDYLREAVVPRGGHAYLVDRFGNVVAATRGLGPQIVPLARLVPPLAAALERSPDGDYRAAGQDWHYTSAPVWPDGWRLVTEAPHRRLYAPADEAQRRFGVVLLAAALFGLVAVAAIGHIAHRRLQGQRQLRRQAAELHAFNTELELLAASISHDLRTPLTAMSAYAEVLAEHYPGRMSAEEAGLFVEKIRSNAARMADLIAALLSFSRLQRGQVDLRRVDLAALTGQVWADLAERRAGRDIRFDLADLPPCQGDPALLRQAVTTLLDNAVESTRDRPVARIEVGYQAGPEGFTTYLVHDDGVTLDPGQLKELFTPFQRLHPTGTYQSVGMGLSLVQRIITRHSGRIWAEARPEGGTTFFFTLPVALPDT
ncbi:sensor histidine kinase [Planomonospora sp. ID91781]|uniref:sensor histidine kinase n=1 Tax=Planomonospora sp. ID91781 TaxID=2738135 RepID=UPI0018C3751C|nr:sensor histidine kinase [Planomonospora sp. ID91781]MBG0826033.1 sensor histidine kinase [Planomonospora sp. ID91781]